MNVEPFRRSAERDLIEQGYSPKTARAIVDVVSEVGLPCATCSGSGWNFEPDPTSSAWFPKPPHHRICRDCNGAGCESVQEQS